MAISDSQAPITVARKQNGAKLGLATVNRCLAAAVLIIVCFAGWEVYSSADAIQGSRPVAIGSVVFDDTPDHDLPPISDILKAWETRPIMYNPEVSSPQPGPDPTPPCTRKTGWVAFAEQNYDMIGSSGREAIVVDKESGKMFFLVVGDELEVKEYKITIAEISAEKVVLTDGKDKATVK